MLGTWWVDTFYRSSGDSSRFYHHFKFTVFMICVHLMRKNYVSPMKKKPCFPQPISVSILLSVHFHLCQTTTSCLNIFSGSKLRFKQIATLTTEETVDAIMHAVLTNRAVACIPRSIYFSHTIMTMLPNKAYMAILKFIGVCEVDEDFIPTRNYQKEAHGVET